MDNCSSISCQYWLHPVGVLLHLDLIATKWSSMWCGFITGVQEVGSVELIMALSTDYSAFSNQSSVFLSCMAAGLDILLSQVHLASLLTCAVLSSPVRCNHERRYRVKCGLGSGLNHTADSMMEATWWCTADIIISFSTLAVFSAEVLKLAHGHLLVNFSDRNQIGAC